MGQHFSVSFGHEGVTSIAQLILQARKVLYYPIVHHRDSSRAIRVGMRVNIVWPTMGRPTRMPHADGALRCTAIQCAKQFFKLSLALPNLQRPLARSDRDSRGVITSVFQPAQTV